MKKNRVDEFIKNPKKALFKLSFPIIIAMIVQTMYNIVDIAFVGRLGADSIAALTFSFPLFFILIALDSGIGIGMGSKISRLMGEKNKKGAENTAMHGLFISFGIAIILITIGALFLKPIFILFGATDTALQLSISYMSIILVGIIFMFPSFVLSYIFTGQGDTKTPMKIQISALVLNIILDPIFIYYLGYGVTGAAIATVISFTVALVLSIYYVKRKSYLDIKINSFRYSPKIIKEILVVGMPATIMMLLLSVYVMFINKLMAHFGIEYVAAFGIASRLESVAVMPLVGFSTAILTLVGMFYGAKRLDLLRNIIWYGIKIATFFSVVIGTIFFISPSLFLKVFTNNVELIAIASPFLRIEVFTFPLMAIGMVISRALQGMGRGIPSLVIALVRIIVVAIPLSYVLVFVFGFGYLSATVSMVIGGLIASILAATWLEVIIRRLNHR